VKRLKEKVRQIIREGRGRSLSQTIKELNPLLRGWIQYFRLSQVKGIFEELDGWLRRKLRCEKWRQWKRPRTRMKELIKRGLTKDHAAKSAYSGRGRWYNAGASHMNKALPKKYFDGLGLLSLVDKLREFQLST
jgi:RNA-directed DNA polymerase